MTWSQHYRTEFSRRFRLANATLTAGAIGAFLVLPPNLAALPSLSQAPLKATLAGKAHCPSAEFGTSVAISGDTATIGAPTAHGGGAVCVYGRSGTHWGLQAVLRDPAHGKYDDFGWTVAVSATPEGMYAMVGALGDGNNNGTAQPDGPVFVYARSGSSWHQVQTISDPLGYHPGNWFGATLAMSGGSAVITSIGVRNFRGTAYIYISRKNSWHLQAGLGNPGTGDFGGLAAISGETAVIGNGGTSSPPGPGSPIQDCAQPPKSRFPDAWVYTRISSKWHLQAHLEADSYSDSEAAVAISGNTILIGAFYISCGGNSQYDGRGDAYVFNRHGRNWLWASTIDDPARSQGDFGTSLGISGSNAIIGAPYSQNVCGVAYAYKLTRGKWVLRTTLEPPGGSKCRKVEGFGWAIAVSGQTAVIGAPGNGKTYVLNFS